MSHRRPRARQSQGVKLNTASMLDMAFQLLTFFILTFRPAPVEGQVSLRMPPPVPIGQAKGDVIGSTTDSPDPLAQLDRLVVSVTASADGDIGTTAIGENGLADQSSGELEIAQLNRRLGDAFTKTAFREMVLQVGSGLRYDRLMQVVEVCSRQTLADGERLSKLTFVELPDSSVERAKR